MDGTALVQRHRRGVVDVQGHRPSTSSTPARAPTAPRRSRKYAARAHGNHNPQHGGQFFMAPDSWHHIEGTYLPSGVFRMHLYDDYTKPLTAEAGP